MVPNRQRPYRWKRWSLVAIGAIAGLLLTTPLLQAGTPIVAKLALNESGRVIAGELRFDLGGGGVQGTLNLDVNADPENLLQNRSGGTVKGRFKTRLDLDGSYAGGSFGVAEGTAKLAGTFTDETNCQANLNGTGTFKAAVSGPLGLAEVTANWEGVEYQGCNLMSPQTLAVTLPLFVYEKQDGIPLAEPAAVLFSDSFNRADADRCALGQADLALGGDSVHYYVPIFNGGDASKPTGARIIAKGLENIGGDYGGIQFTRSNAVCTGARGENLGQDLYLRVDLLAPADAAGNLTQAGPYLRSRAAARGDGIIGGDSAGYWVQLHSTGEVKIKRLNPQAIVAASDRPVSFDSRVFHTLEIAAQGSALQVALDGRRLTFVQDGRSVATVSIPATSGSNDGAAGLAFAAETNRGKLGGQRAENLVITSYRPLSAR